MNRKENDIFHDMQHVCKSGSAFCQKGEASSCNKCIFYESKVEELTFKNDECQREIHRLCQTVGLSCFMQQIAEKISEINSTLHDKIESISGKTLEQDETAEENTVQDANCFLEIQMVVPKEDLPETSPSGDLINAPVDSYSLEDTMTNVGVLPSVPDETRKETGKGSNGNRTCMWMIKDGLDQRTTCGKVFPTIESLVTHSDDEHFKKGPVLVCFWEGCKRNELPFKRRRNLISHFRSHSGEKPFTCPQEGCGRAFSELCAVRLHMNTHSKATFPCTYPGCRKVFNHKHTMLIHNRVRHRDEGTFKCPFDGCGMNFKGSYDLRKHSVRHTMAKPHVCKFPRCSMSFASKECRDEHFAQHGEGRAKKR